MNDSSLKIFYFFTIFAGIIFYNTLNIAAYKTLDYEIFILKNG